MTKKRNGKQRSEKFGNADELSRLYHGARREEPPAHVDVAILAAAREAARPTARWRGPFGSHWMFPVSAAAVVVLTIGAFLFMQREGVVPLSSESVSPHDGAIAQPLSEVVEKRKVTPATSKPTPAPRTLAKSGSPAPAAPAAIPPQELADVSVDKKSAQVLEPKVAETAPPVAESFSARAKEFKPETVAAAAPKPARASATADVLSVKSSGTPGAYKFDVTLVSPNAGCQRYADWWEVVSDDGRLLHRHLLEHHHTDGQPFTRAGGPVPIAADTIVWVRAHLRSVGYGGAVFKGSVQNGFQRAEPPPGFAAALATQPPVPRDCGR